MDIRIDSLYIVLYSVVVGLVSTNTPAPLSEYLKVHGKFVAPIPRNSITIIHDISLQLCAAKCTLAFRMKTFPCYAFEYTPGSRMCVHTNVTSLVVNGGFLGLKDNQAVDYYERSKASYANLFQSHDHAALKQQNSYFSIKLNRTLEECAYECMRSTSQTCMSFSHSPSTGACGLSNVFYGEGQGEITLLTSRIYNHYQYYTSWPCNATIPENYGPQAIASLRFPYKSFRHGQCHVQIEAPIGKQVQILLPTIFFGENVCSRQTGLTIYDGVSGSSPVLGHYCHSTSDRLQPPLLTSSSGSLYVTYNADDVPLAFQSIYQFVTIDPCERNLCKNNATCKPQNQSYVCECPVGFTGQFCGENIDDCASSPCLFLGQCIDHVNGYSCNCTQEFTGDRCENFIGACADQPCDHGTCVVTSRYNYTCNCFDGYVGTHCNMKFSPCMSNPCVHGTCGDTSGDYICKCATGYTGRNCDQLAVDLCTFSPCKHGSCVSTSNLNDLCSCDVGYTGQYCEIEIDLCTAVNCNNGMCIKTNSSVTCQCHGGFKGQFCDVAMTVCERHANVCSPGQCYPYSNVPEGYVCFCPDNKYHRHCNSTFDPCSSSPCHHGTCNPDNNGYSCSCANGYVGSHCNVSTCAVADCGLGLCEDKTSGYNCICPVGYHGKNCEFRVPSLPQPSSQSANIACRTSPCQNKATCVQENIGFSCICSEGWTGSLCDIRANACASSPCGNSICEPVGSGYRCSFTNNSSPGLKDISTPTPTAQTSNVTTTTPTSPLTRSDIDCGGSSISLHVPLDLLPSGQQVTWNDPACVVSNNGTHLTGDIDLGECGTYVFFNATHVIFENELVSHASTANSTSGAHSVIDYGNGPDSVIVVQCVYPRREQESLGFRPIQGQVRLYEKTLGHMQVHMREARDVRFDDMYPSQTEPRVVHLNDPIYIKLDTEQGNTTKVAINVDRCLATPSPSPLDTDFQELTDNGCPALPSVTIHSSPVSEVHLSFQAFKFTNHPSAPVYVHCEVYVCPLSDPHCVTGCTDSVARTRRAATGGIKTHLVSTGPFPVADDKDQGGFGGESTALVAVTGLCAVLAVAATIFGVMAWRGRRRLSLKEPLVQ